MLLGVLVLPISPGESMAQALTYPTTRRDSVVDDYHGTKVADPYRWLEHLDTAGTVAWVRAQTRLTEDHLRRIGDRDAFRRRLTALWNHSRTEVPWRESGRLFYVENTGLQSQPVLYMQDTLDESARTVLDPQRISPDGSVAIRDFAVSPNLKWLAYASSAGGADAGEMHVLEIATGRDQGDVVRGTWSNACWTHDGGGFFYMRPPARVPGRAADAPEVGKQLYYHSLGQPQERDRLVHEWKDARWVYTMMSDDGRRAITVMERGASSRMYTIDLGSAKVPDVAASFVPLLGDAEASFTPMGTVGDTLFVFCNLDAPRGRVIALDLSRGADAQPRTVIAEAADVIQGATVAGDRLAVHYLHDVKSRLRLFTLAGRPVGEIALPGIGALGWALNGRHSAPELWYSFESFLTPETVYHYDMASGKSTPFHSPLVPFDASAFETRQVFYASKDGTRIPMFITGKMNAPRGTGQPTFLTAYGGYGSVMSPSFRADIPMWLEMGGLYVVANLRGGGEYGESWHRAGSLEKKQNSFDDFIAAAEYLVSERYTTARKLAIYGHSNGGLLIGAALTQRPDLFAAAIANAGHYDMLRYHRFTTGGAWIPEYGSPDQATQFPYLRAYSPLHNVRDGTCYPATLLLAADHDDRVVPSHSYKFAAALQAAQGCERPILLRVATDASHSYASAAAEIAELSDRWAFIAARVGAKVPRRR